MRRWILPFISLLAALALTIPTFASSFHTTSRAAFPAVAPNFACSDTMYQQAAGKGITLGISPDSPYTYLNPRTKQPTGIDWDINTAALHWAGIKTIRYAIMPFDSLIPALLSHRIDVIADNIHETPVRNKTITFSSPAWWYGPALIVQKGNPAHIRSYADLNRPGVTVGTITGSAADEYITHLGAHMVSTYGYSYARYGLRKSDCTLNFAYTRALAELRTNGTIPTILRKWGLNPHNNLFIPGTF